MAKDLFRHRSMVWALYYEDYSDLTIDEIAEIFDTSDSAVYSAIHKIKEKTGKSVKYIPRHSREHLQR